MRERKLKDPVTLFASIEREDHEILRELSYKTHRSMADLTRDLLKKGLEQERARLKGQG